MTTISATISYKPTLCSREDAFHPPPIAMNLTWAATTACAAAAAAAGPPGAVGGAGGTAATRGVGGATAEARRWAVSYWGKKGSQLVVI